MSRLVRLYPAAWRARYEAEFLSLLEERPPSFRDRADILLGALDARLRPQVGVAEHVPIPFTHRLPGVAAITGGILLCAAFAGILAGPDWEATGSGLLGLSFVVGFLSLPGMYFERYARQLKWGFGAGAIAVLSTALLPWPLMIVPWLALVGLVVAGMLALAAARSGLSARARWTLLALVVGLPIIPALPVLMGLPGDRVISAALAVAAVLPYGVAWVVIGLRMARRGTPTFLPAGPSLPTLEEPS